MGHGLGNVISNLNSSQYILSLDMKHIEAGSDIEKGVKTSPIDPNFVMKPTRGKSSKEPDAPKSEKNTEKKTARQELYGFLSKNTSWKTKSLLKNIIQPRSSTAISVDRARVAMRIADPQKFGQLLASDLKYLTPKEFSEYKKLYAERTVSRFKEEKVKIDTFSNVLDLARSTGLEKPLLKFVKAQLDAPFEKKMRLYESRLEQFENGNLKEPPTKPSDVSDKERLSVAKEFMDRVLDGPKLMDKVYTQFKKAIAKATVQDFEKSFERAEKFKLKEDQNPNLQELPEGHVSTSENVPSWNEKNFGKVIENFNQLRLGRGAVRDIPGLKGTVQDMVTKLVHTKLEKAAKGLANVKARDDNPEGVIDETTKILSKTNREYAKVLKSDENYMKNLKVDKEKPVLQVEETPAEKLEKTKMQQSYINRRIEDLTSQLEKAGPEQVHRQPFLDRLSILKNENLSVEQRFTIINAPPSRQTLYAIEILNNPSNKDLFTAKTIKEDTEALEGATKWPIEHRADLAFRYMAEHVDKLKV